MTRTTNRAMFALLTLLLVVPMWSLTAVAAQQTTTCHFFTETGGGQGGFFVCDDAEARFHTALEMWGLEKIGFPISQRYTHEGFVTQAFQKVIMQWHPETGSVALVNIFDDLHRAGLDSTLLYTYQIPNQFPAGWDGDIPFEEVIKRRQALLDSRSALRDAYFASPDPFTLYGLPTSYASDMGNHYAIRLQRAVLQEWKEDVPWASAGQVTIANGGELAKQLGGLPAEAVLVQAFPVPENRAEQLPPTPQPPAPAPPTPPAPPTRPAPPTPQPRVNNGVVYLTFDDGVAPEYTNQILDLLAQYNAQATFFVLGKNAMNYPDLIKNVYMAGHAIGNHTWDHSWLVGMAEKDIVWQIQSTEEVLGRYGSRCLRPPFGEMDEFASSVVEELGYRIVMWDIDTRDWQRPGANVIVSTVLQNVYPGAIILMHDGGGNRQQTVTALTTILPELTAQGYHFERLCR